MTHVNEPQVIAALAGVPVPDIPIDLAATAQLHEQSVCLNIGYPVASRSEAIAALARQALARAGIDLSVEVRQAIPAAQTAAQAVPGVKNIVAVASGKGGVGKSTTTANLALALAAEGAQVGILDADIYGPSQTLMMGTGAQRPEVLEGKRFLPLLAHGVQVISMGNLITDNTPMAWRGPMATGALKQLLHQTQWQQVDYLLVDMPPGTGDITLTLSQSVPVTSSVVVTTPQDIALLDARKAIAMFNKVNIDIAGVVENMAMHQCSHCGHQEAIFGEHGGARLAEEYETVVLGRLPLDRQIRVQADGGAPSVVADPDGAISAEYRAIALKLATHLWQRQLAATVPEITVTEE